VVIGVSTGGPAALSQILPRIPAGFPAPILVAQHMPAMFTRLLAERLNLIAKLEVKEAQDEEAVIPERVLIAPGDWHLRVKASPAGKVVVTLDRAPLENACRPAADVLFRSAGEVWGGAVMAVVLTGMGQDGLKGARFLSELGAYVMAQDQASSVVWGMPRAVVSHRLAHSVVALEDMPVEICRQFPRQTR
jgi:two-component system chemotaxis response regulator CheB